jgi:hypothetical protein
MGSGSLAMILRYLGDRCDVIYTKKVAQSKLTFLAQVLEKIGAVRVNEFVSVNQASLGMKKQRWIRGFWGQGKVPSGTVFN